MTSTKIKRVEGAVGHATGAAAMDSATGMMRVCFQCLMLWKQFKAIFAAVADILTCQGTPLWVLVCSMMNKGFGTWNV